MPKGYTHLAYEQRCQIYTLLKRGDSKLFIAKAIGVNISTIIRELRRNCGKRGYRFKQANRKAILGDFEGDTIVDARHRSAIVSPLERKTKVTRLALIQKVSAEEAHNAMIDTLIKIKNHVLTITTDNEKEFAKHVDTAKKLSSN